MTESPKRKCVNRLFEENSLFQNVFTLKLAERSGNFFLSFAVKVNFHEDKKKATY